MSCAFLQHQMPWKDHQAGLDHLTSSATLIQNKMIIIENTIWQVAVKYVLDYCLSSMFYLMLLFKRFCFLLCFHFFDCGPSMHCNTFCGMPFNTFIQQGDPPQAAPQAQQHPEPPPCHLHPRAASTQGPAFIPCHP